MRIGVISDTHGHVVNTKKTVELLKRQQVDLLIHCGDIGSTAVIHLLEQWPVHYVQGNVDRHSERAYSQCAEESGGTWHGDFGSLQIDGREIAFLHGDDTRRLQETISSGEYSLVCHGHTHQQKLEQQGSTQVLNPGAVFRANPHTIAILDTTQAGNWEITHLPL